MFLVRLAIKKCISLVKNWVRKSPHCLNLQLPLPL